MSDVEKSDNGLDIVSDPKTLKLEKAKYNDSQNSADDNRSSGWVLLIVGFIGIVAVILGITGVIPVKFGNPYLFYGVLCAIFILFLVMGGVSFANAKKYESRAKGEKTLKDSICKWAKANLKADEIDKEIYNIELESNEILYFKRSKIILDKLNEQFVNLDPQFIEKFVDDYIYDMIFPITEADSLGDDLKEADVDLSDDEFAYEDIEE